MKSNCSIMNVEDLAEMVAANLKEFEGESVQYKADSCYLTEDAFWFVRWNDKNECFDTTEKHTLDELCEMVGCKSWERVTIEDGYGCKLAAVLFYTDV